MSWHLLCVGIFNILISCGLFSQLCTFTYSHLFFSHCCLVSCVKMMPKSWFVSMETSSQWCCSTWMPPSCYCPSHLKKYCHIKWKHCEIISEFIQTKKIFQIKNISKTTVKSPHEIKTELVIYSIYCGINSLYSI